MLNFDRPSGFKRADWNFCFHILIFGKKLGFFVKKKKKKYINKKADRLAVFWTARTGNDNSSKDGLTFVVYKTRDVLYLDFQK